MATDHTNFCCRSGGDNLNAGTRTGSNTEPGTTADLTYASGNWVQSTGVFTVASGNPVSDGVAVGDFASVYADGSTVTGCVAIVTARTTTTITVSSTVISGTKPTNGTGDRTLKIGGAWAGPSGATAFPFGFITSALVKAASKHPRVNFKNDQNYDITSAITHANQLTNFRGYTSAYEDSGRATFRGPDGGASIAILTLSGPNTSATNLIFTRNGDSGSATGFVASGSRLFVRNCIFHTLPGYGLNISAGGFAIECEAYACNSSNTSGLGGLAGASAMFVRCISHDNTGSNSSGFVGSSTYLDCIADSNGQHGLNQTLNSHVYVSRCDFYNNGAAGINNANGATVIENCNFIKNGTYGISTLTNPCSVIVMNCAFGAGTMANTSGTINPSTLVLEESGTVTYGSNLTPWVDPANGDFRLNLATAMGVGRGTFVQTASSYAGAFSYNDIGSNQSQYGGGVANVPTIINQVINKYLNADDQ